MDDSLFTGITKMIDENEVISFDIFDTLLLRNVLKPIDLFRILEKEVFEKFAIDDFCTLRVQAEEKSRLEKNSYETTLDMIYDNIDWPDKKFLKVSREIEALEIELEQMFLTFNPFMKRVYDYCIEKGKTVICITDMYLPKKVLEMSLEKNGYKDVEVFLSCDYMKQKRDGTLYEVVYENKKYDKSKWLHIGDNRESDYIQAKNFGINAFHYKKVSERAGGVSNRDYPVEQSIIYAILFNNLYNGLSLSNNFYEGSCFDFLTFLLFIKAVYDENREASAVDFVKDDGGEVLKTLYELFVRENDGEKNCRQITTEEMKSSKNLVVALSDSAMSQKEKFYFLVSTTSKENSFCTERRLHVSEHFEKLYKAEKKFFKDFATNVKKYARYVKDISLDECIFDEEKEEPLIIEKKKGNRFASLFDKETIIAGILMIIMVVLFFAVPIFIMPDSAEYYKYLQIFNGSEPLANWDVTRGFSFPSVLFVITKIFGDSQTGLLIGTSIFYLVFNILSYLMYRSIKKDVPGRFKRIIMTVGYYVLILFNPIIYGYFHVLYTEIVAIPLMFLACMVAYKFLNFRFDARNVKSYIYVLYFMVLFVFCWFLKQPYFTIALFPLSIVLVISIFKYKSLKDFLYRFVTLILCTGTLLFSISSWKNFLVSNGVDYANGRNNENFLRRAIVLGLSDLRIVEDEKAYTWEAIEKDELISFADKEKIKKRNNQKYVILDVRDKNGVAYDRMIMYYDKDDYSSKDSFKFWLQALWEHPTRVLDSYYSGYLATIDIYVSVRDANGDYFPRKEYRPDLNNENVVVGLAYVYLDKNILWTDGYPQLMNATKNLHQDVTVNENVRTKIADFADIHFKSFKIAFLLLPFLLLYVVFQYIFGRRHEKKYELAGIFLGTAFLHIIFHVFMGAIIDRYVFIAFPEIIIGCCALMISYKKEIIPVCSRKKENGKTIFVIPAYNEEKHIAHVIEDIHENMPEADIVITNDFSKDRTREIVESLGVPCLNVPFNMGYAMAVQTGIKYACYNGYDYVVQFDADGQHLASEAKKLFVKHEETGANIVIGSRFLEKTEYKHPFFRKIGTKMFQIIIKLFCKKDITDPTSGFQLLDRSVIERYAKIGKYPEFPDANLIIEMLMAGYKIDEVSVKMKLNDEGKSMHGGIIKPIKYMINVTYTIMFILLKKDSKRD